MSAPSHAARLALLADALSPHTVKWAQEFAQRGWEVHVLSLRPSTIDQVSVHCLSALPGRLGYAGAAIGVRQAVRRLAPSILHAHYATSYGLLGGLARWHPLVISLWGSDVYDFPGKSPWHGALLAHNLAAADAVTATSADLARSAGPWLGDRIAEIIPFGVDLDRFIPGQGPDVPTLGMLKPLARIYGQDVLLHALSLVVGRDPSRSLRLRLAGEGPARADLERQVARFGLADRVEFLGALAPDRVPAFLRDLTILAMPSRRESFGVVAVEAAASGVPVVASWVGGVPEVVSDGETGLLVPPDNAAALADAIVRLLDDSGLRAQMGQAGRRLVAERYSWPDTADRMERLYRSLLEGRAHG